MKAPVVKLWGLLIFFAACNLTEGEPCLQDKPCFGPMRRAEQGQVLIYNNGAEPQHLDPGLATGTPDGRIINAQFEGLMDYHPRTLQPVPSLASKIPDTPDFQHFRFDIRENANWSNGDPVTAHDFVYSWERVLHPLTGAQYAYILYPLQYGEEYLLETVRTTTHRVTLSGTQNTPGILEAGEVVKLEESNAARLAEELSLSASAGASPSGTALEADQVVLVSKNRTGLAKPGENEKETWVEVTAYPDIDLESAQDISQKLSGATARRGWVKAAQIKPFFPSSNRRVLAEQATLKQLPSKTANDVKDPETRKTSTIPKNDEVRILRRVLACDQADQGRNRHINEACSPENEGEWIKVYWPKRARYGYVKRELLLNPWGEVYQFKVSLITEKNKDDKEEEPTPSVATPPVSAETPSSTTLPTSLASTMPTSAPAITIQKDFSKKTEGWVYAKDLLLDPKILGFRAVDDKTLEVTLKNPTPYFLTLLAHYTYRAIHPNTFEEWGNQWTKPENVVVNGAFVLTEYLSRDRAVLMPNETYWDRKNVKLTKVVAYMMDNLNTSLMMYKAGQTDLIVANDMPSEYIPAFYDYAKSDSTLADFEVATALGSYFYRINTTKKPFDDVRVRKALAMSVDRTKVPKVTHIPVTPSYSVTPPGIPGANYDPPKGPGFDVEGAKKLLAEAGYPDGKGFPAFSILYNTQDQHRKIAEYIQEQWRKNLNIQVNLANKEWKTYLDSVQSINYDVARAGWIGDYLDPLTFLDMWITDGGNNNTGWGKPRYDSLITKAQSTSDPAKRVAVLQEMETMINEDMPVIPIYSYVWFALTKPYVKGFYPNMLDQHPLKWVCIETSMLDGSQKEVCKDIESKIAQN